MLKLLVQGPHFEWQGISRKMMHFQSQCFLAICCGTDFPHHGKGGLDEYHQYTRPELNTDRAILLPRDVCTLQK